MRAPGEVRDAILSYLTDVAGDASIEEIIAGVGEDIGPVAPSTVRSYLGLNTPALFERVERGRYRVRDDQDSSEAKAPPLITAIGNAQLVLDNCFQWLAEREPASIHAVVTDPPYGLVEYSGLEQGKLRAGKGGVWRIPPSYDGHRRSPLPRFTTLSRREKMELYRFFRRLARLLVRVLVPGGNVVVASNPLLSHLVATAFEAGGLEARGSIVRLVMTMRGGDRPKNAHKEFQDVSVMPRSMWEPWVVARKPLDGRVQDTLRQWETGGFRRFSEQSPFGDVIKSSPTSPSERKLAPHPSLKPQAFMRQIVRAVLPMGKGVVLDPFAGSGSTLAAANHIGYESIGVELDPTYYNLAAEAIPRLAALRTA